MEPLIDEFLGKKYKLVTSENFEEYLKFVGVGMIARKFAASVTPVACLTKNERGDYTITMTTTLRTITITFPLDREFDEVRPDGAKLRSLVKFEDNKIVHTQRESNGRTSLHIREFYKNRMIQTITADGWTEQCIRIFEIID